MRLKVEHYKTRPKDMPWTSRKPLPQYLDTTVQAINLCASGILACAVTVTLADITPKDGMVKLEFSDSTGNVSSKSIFIDALLIVLVKQD